MENNINNTGNVQEPAGEKTFTQEEVNNIVRDRLARAKNGTDQQAREQELQQRENDLYIKEQIMSGKLPQDVADVFKGLDKERINSIIDVMTPYFSLKQEPILNPTGLTRTPQDTNATELLQIRAAMGLKG